MEKLKVKLKIRNDYLMNIISPIVDQMVAAGRGQEATAMMSEIINIGKYGDATEIVNRYVDIEYEVEK